MQSTFGALERLLPTPLVKFSVLLHAGVGVMVVDPRLRPWAVALFVANHVALCWGGLWPRSGLLGPNRTRLPAGADRIALTIDDGPDPQVTPQVLELLAAHGARATFFCVGVRVEQHPELARRIRAEGHEIGNHSQHHYNLFSLFGPWRMAREIELAQASITRVCGVRPRWFRAPAGLRNIFLQPQLSRLGLALASWTRRGFDTVTPQPAKVIQALLRDLAAGDILLLHDGQVARTSSGEPVILAVLPKLLEQLASRKLRCVTLSDGVGVE